MGLLSALPCKRQVALRIAQSQTRDIESTSPLKLAYFIAAGLLLDYCLVGHENHLASRVTNLADTPERTIGLANLKRSADPLIVFSLERQSHLTSVWDSASICCYEGATKTATFAGNH